MLNYTKKAPTTMYLLLLVLL